MRPVRAGVIELDFQMQGENLRDFIPKKKVPYVWVYMISPQGSLGKISARWGVLIFFKKLPKGFEILLFLGGEEKGGGGGGPFFCEMA